MSTNSALTRIPSAGRRSTERGWAFHGKLIFLLKEAGNAWLADNVPRLSASLAFYAVLSLIPFLIVLLTIAARALGPAAAQGQLNWEIRNLTGVEGAKAIQGLLKLDRRSTGITVFGLLTLAFGASAVVMELRDALNTIWHAPRSVVSSGLTGFLRTARERFYLFGLILGAGFLMLASLALNALIAALSAEYGLFFPLSPALLHAFVFIGTFLVVTLLFATIYKLVPDVRLKWNDVFVGASFTSLLFTIGKQVIGIYLGKTSYGSTYGTAGSFVIVLLWVYYSAQLFFFGAEFTRVFATRVHHRKPPDGL